MLPKFEEIIVEIKSLTKYAQKIWFALFSLR